MSWHINIKNVILKIKGLYIVYCICNGSYRFWFDFYCEMHGKSILLSPYAWYGDNLRMEHCDIYFKTSHLHSLKQTFTSFVEPCNIVCFISKESIPHRKYRLYTFGFTMLCRQANDTWLCNQILLESTMHNNGPNNGPNGISFTSEGTSRERFSFCITLLCRFLNFDYLGSARIQCYSK